jgi:voltage-gated potassium channel
MVVLSFVWLSLVVVELMWTTSGVFELLGTLIWIVFIAEFILRFVLAPRKLRFLRRNPDHHHCPCLRPPSGSCGP